MQRRNLLTTAATAAALSTIVRVNPARAAEHQVEMLNQAPDGTRNAYRPLILEIEPGDSVTFVSTNPGHNSISQVVPEGGEEWRGGINEEITVTLTVPGVYVYYCLPHRGLGMIGAIVVGGDVSNLEEVKAARYVGQSRGVAEEIIAELEAMA